MAIEFTNTKKAKERYPNRKKWEPAIVETVKQYANLNVVDDSIRNRMIKTDLAYYASKFLQDEEAQANTQSLEKCVASIEDMERKLDMQVPLVATQTDTVLAILAQVFFATPSVFPVLGTPGFEDPANMLEAMNEFFARLGGWQSELLKALLDGIKYNLFMVDPTWDHMSIYERGLVGDSVQFTRVPLGFSRIRYVDPFRAVWDTAYDPMDVTRFGDFFGYTVAHRRNALKQQYKLWDSLNLLSKGAEEINWSSRGTSVVSSSNALYYTKRPSVTNVPSPSGEFTWDNWIFGNAKKSDKTDYSNHHFITTMYLRIDPDDFHLPNESGDIETWRFDVHNLAYVVRAEPVMTMDTNLGVLMGQLIDDGYGYQTKSISESIIVLQDSASDTLNARFAANRRAINDKVIYNPAYIDRRDMFSKTASPAIAMKNSLGQSTNIKISDIFYKVPFDHAAAQLLLQDLELHNTFAQETIGINDFRQGQSIPGRRTASEFTGIMQHSSLRTSIYSLPFVFRFMNPLSETLKLQALQHEAEISELELENSRTNQTVKLNRTTIVQFLLKIQYTTGYWPKEILANAQGVQFIFNLLATAPHIFAGRYDLGRLLDYMAHIIGVRELGQFKLPTPTVGPGELAPPAPPGAAPRADTPLAQQQGTTL